MKIYRLTDEDNREFLFKSFKGACRYISLMYAHLLTVQESEKLKSFKPSKCFQTLYIDALEKCITIESVVILH